MLFSLMIFLAASSSSATAASSEQAAPSAPKQICRTIVMTGTRIKRKKKVCATAEEWQKTANDIADNIYGLNSVPNNQVAPSVPN